MPNTSLPHTRKPKKDLVQNSPLTQRYVLCYLLFDYIYILRIIAFHCYTGVYIFQNTMVGGGEMAGWGKKKKLKELDGKRANVKM